MDIISPSREYDIFAFYPFLSLCIKHIIINTFTAFYLFVFATNRLISCVSVCVWYAYFIYMCVCNENRLFCGREPVSAAEEFLHLSKLNLLCILCIYFCYERTVRERSCTDQNTPKSKSVRRLRAFFILFYFFH